MRRLIYNLISVIFTFFKFIVLKMIKPNKFYYRGIQRFSPNTEVIITKNGVLKLGERIRAHRRTKITVSENGILEIGDNVSMGNGVSIYCFEKIRIGKNTGLGQDSKIYDHDHDFRAKGGYISNKFLTSEVIIGENTWIGSNVVILRGTRIGNNCVVASGCVLKGEYPDNSIIIQKRDTQVISYEYISN